MEPNTKDLAGSDGVSVHAGFPNPAIDRREKDGSLILDINQLLVQHPSSTYLFRIAGHHWSDQGIYDGDIAVIDRALTPQPTDLVVDWQDGFCIERQRGRPATEPVWGVVTAIIHQYDRT